MELKLSDPFKKAMSLYLKFEHSIGSRQKNYEHCAIDSNLIQITHLKEKT